MILAIVTIIYKLVLVLIGALILLIRPAELMVYLEPAESIIYLGMGLNVICIIGLYLVVFDPHIIRAFASHTLALINKIRPFAIPKSSPTGWSGFWRSTTARQNSTAATPM